ncbi:MAG: hypothetical protein RBS80_04510 [Thermoguttaceae bacterium]|nr:hypothetical protein [Thermoguttaceae bacterium]
MMRIHCSRKQLAAIGVALAGVVIVGVLLCRFVESHRRKARAEWAELERRAWAVQLDPVIAGKSTSILLAYDPPDLDKKLQDLEGLEYLTGLGLDGIDMTGNRLASIAAIPNLKRVFFYRCGPLTNRDFEHLRGNTSIEEMRIVRDSQNEPLPVLATLPNLKLLIFFQGQVPAGSPAGPVSLDWLAELHQLEQLEVGGEGVTAKHIQDLRKRLPHVTVEPLMKEPTMR